MNNSLTVALKWSALCLTLTGAVLTSLAIDPMNIILLNLGCVLYVIWAVRVGDRNLTILNATLLAIYLVGLAARPVDKESTACNMQQLTQVSKLQERIT